MTAGSSPGTVSQELVHCFVGLLLGDMRTLEYVKLLSASEVCSANP